jgi:DNA invertase Pin-like site-specific DNA recombinase
MTTGKNIAYVRVSTVEQNEGRQLEALKTYDIDKTFVEKASAKDTHRPKLQEMLDYVREGDTVYILDFSRLARSTKDLLNIVEMLTTKGVKLISLKENLDTNTPAGKMMLTMLGAIYEFERTNILERQREGIILAKRAGKYKGRKRILPPEDFEAVFERWDKRELTGREAMKELKLKPNTFYKILTEWKNRKGIGETNGK